jgi:iron complex outermembrane receptor protein
MSRIDSKWSNTGLLTLIALLFAGLAPANVAVAADEEAAIEEVVVTGSRIKRTGMETASPISVFTSADIEASGFNDD